MLFEFFEFRISEPEVGLNETFIVSHSVRLFLVRNHTCSVNEVEGAVLKARFHFSVKIYKLLLNGFAVKTIRPARI